MVRTILVLVAIVLVAFLVIGSVHNKGVKDNYGKPLGKVVEQVAKDISTGADVTTKEISKKAKDLTENK